jgi:hypothetical protein
MASAKIKHARRGAMAASGMAAAQAWPRRWKNHLSNAHRVARSRHRGMAAKHQSASWRRRKSSGGVNIGETGGIKRWRRRSNKANIEEMAAMMKK